MNGFIIVNKDKDMTSHDVCHKVKRILNINKIGHTGTLDPNTTGVLVCGINQATKLMPLFNSHDKEYLTTIMFGISTDTLDITGKVINEEKVKEVDVKLLDIHLDTLSKQTSQIPPIYSAIKVDGKKLMMYAKENKEVELKPRDVVVYEIKRKSNIYEKDGYLCVDVYLNVGKGYYVRSLINDLSNMLAIPATMKELTRLSCGQFNMEQSNTLEDIKNDNYKFIDIEELLSDLPKLEVNEYISKLVKNGVMLDQRQIITDKPFRVYHNNKLIAIYEVVKENNYKPLLIIK